MQLLGIWKAMIGDGTCKWSNIYSVCVVHDPLTLWKVKIIFLPKSVF